MLNSFLFGLLAASSLAIGAAIALRFRIRKYAIGIIMAFGVGAMINLVTFELVEDAFAHANDIGIVIVGILVGAITYFALDSLVDRISSRRHTPSSKQSGGIAILTGTVLDGIPESIIIGLSIATSGTVGIATIATIFISNIPEALSSTTELARGGWSKLRIVGLWTIVIAVSGLASLVGYAIFGSASSGLRAFIMAFAGGAVLTMLANSMMPTAYRDTGKWAGIVTTIGFCIAFAISMLG
ncbi:hypothetical protein LJC07_05410 [Christensenellaceae bacterium OttesenSCG-928-L17]|nr:hypothetical protein [Christensenellaceae bacterium OttesenSCG-928-L17]